MSFQFDGGENDAGRGTTAPVVSPDGRRIAFTRDNDLWIRDIKGGHETRLTRHGRRSDDSFASVYVLIAAWSSNGKMILYNVNHSDPVDPDGIEPPREVRTAPYGFRVYDIDRSASRAMPLAGDFHAWLPDGRFLVSSSDRGYLNGALMVQKPGVDMPEKLVPVRGFWGQPDVSSDGRWLVVSLGQSAPPLPDQLEDETELQSRIVKIDLRTGAMKNLTEPGSWSEYQTPRFSPSGLKMAWVRQSEPDTDGFTKGTVMIDGVPVTDLPMPVEPDWIDDETLAVVSADGIRVLRTDGKVIIHRP